MNKTTHPPVFAFFARYPEMRPELGSDFSPGWQATIIDALQDVVDLNREARVSIRVAQIKQKMGGLRIHLRCPRAPAIAPSERVVDLLFEKAVQTVREAEERCSRLCEVCGAPGLLMRDGGWLRTCCEVHAHSDFRALVFDLAGTAE